MDAMLLLKASVVLSSGLLAAFLLRSASAAARHRYWTLMFAAVLALPVLAVAIPVVHIPVPVRLAAPAPTLPTTPANDTVTIGEVRLVPSIPAQVVHFDSPTTQPTRSLDLSDLQALLPIVWLWGTIAALSALLVSLLRVNALARSADDLIDVSWRQAADAIATALGIQRRVRLLVSDRVGTPMAGGLWRPAIFLPTSAIEWSAERRDVVLAHEMAHLAGRDSLRHLLVRLGVALYWFHPLAWIAARRAAMAREEACDQAVLALGTRPSTYARVLLDLAESIHPTAPLVAALPIIEPSLLEMRLMAILKDTRPAARPLALIPTLMLTALTLSVAAAQPSVPDMTPSAAVVTESTKMGRDASPADVDAAESPVQPIGERDSPCWGDVMSGASFSGSISTSNESGRMVIREQVGTRGNNFVIQKNFGDLRVCMIAADVESRDGMKPPSQWAALAPRVVMEARRGGTVQRLTIEQRGQRMTWQVGATQRPMDDAARQWRESILAVLDTTWELSSLGGEVSSLRGEISSIRGEQSSLRGQISSYRGHVSSLRGAISSHRGEESSLSGEISSIRGHVSSLRGAISSARGSISSLHAGRNRSDDARVARSIAEHEAEIARIEREISEYNADAKVAAVERQIAGLQTDGKIAAIEAEIKAFSLESKVADVERRIAALDVEGKVAAIERKIQALDADRRGQELENRRAADLKRLEAAIAAIR